MTEESQSQPASTLTRMLTDSSDDALLHRALELPRRFPDHIQMTDTVGLVRKSKYVFADNEPIGEGGTAIVFSVRDTELNALRALKVLLVDTEQDQDALRRWQHEREVLLHLEQIDASGVPTVFDVGSIEGLPAIVMQSIEGYTLHERLASSTWSPKEPSSISVERRFVEAVQITLGLCKTMSQIERGLDGPTSAEPVHGDVKPSNIKLQGFASIDDTTIPDTLKVWLLDFGEASLHLGSPTHGITPGYASPEQVERFMAGGGMTNGGASEQVSPLSDQFQIGVLLQQMLLLIKRSRTALKKSPWSLKSRLHGLAVVGQRMTARQPADRYPSFRAVVEAIEASRAAPARRLRFSIGLAAVIMLAVSVVGVGGYLAGQADRPNALVASHEPISSETRSSEIRQQWLRWLRDHNTASLAQLQKELTIQYERWRHSLGDDNADQLRDALADRITFINGGKYELAMDNVRLKDFNPKYRKPELLGYRIFVEIDEKLVSEATVLIGNQGTLTFTGGSVLTFEWSPGQAIALSIADHTQRLPTQSDLEFALRSIPFPLNSSHYGSAHRANEAGGALAILLATNLIEYRGKYFTGKIEGTLLGELTLRKLD